MQRSAQLVKALFERWKQLARNRKPSEEDEFDWTRNELLSGIQNIELDLGDLSKAVSAGEKDPRLKLSADEISNRRKFISDLRDKIAVYKNEVSSGGRNTAREASPSHCHRKPAFL